jgi:hypothetical protein
LRPSFTTATLLLSVIISATLFWVRYNDENSRFDELLQTLESLKPILPPGGSIFIKNKTDWYEADFQLMNALAPVQISQLGTETPDSVLYILPLTDTVDNVSLAYSGKAVVWQAQDNNLKYVFIVKK